MARDYAYRFTRTDADLELFRRELDRFVPDTICDAHMHLWAKTHLPPTGYDAFRELEEDIIDLAVYRRRMAELLPGGASPAA